ncbi:MAG: sulfotransferase family protein [Candidatus Limnocylindria bacterium]
MSRFPDFFIVGAPKCGTTALYDYLLPHPGVFMPFHKEPLYFGADLTRRYGAMSENDYVALFRDARSDQVVGEASAWYLYSTTAASEIQRASPDARIIVMLRNPVDVMHAQHSQLLFSEQEEIVDFGEALAAEEDRAVGRRLPPGPIRPENLLYRRMVRFAEQLSRYIDVFGHDRIHVIIHDDLRRDTAREYRRVLDFLSVDPTFTPEFRASNENKRVRRRWLQRLIWDPPLLRALIPVVRRYPIVHRLRARLLALNSVRAPRAPLDPDLRHRLEEELTPEVEALGALLGRDLSHWSRSTAP